MPFGSITEHIDAAQTALWLFLIGFGAIVYYLRKLDKREGYPMKASPFDPTQMMGFPVPAEPKVFLLMEGGTTVAPHHYPQAPVSAAPVHGFGGTPLAPVGDPLVAGIGPGAWVVRRDGPMLTEKGEPMLQPLRCLPEWSVVHGEPDLRGRPVLDRRFFSVGTVTDLWVDRSIKILRLFEVTLHDPASTAPVLVPIFHADIRMADREIRVMSLDAHQFDGIPRTAAPDVITAREDERLNAYFAAGRFYRDDDATRIEEHR